MKTGMAEPRVHADERTRQERLEALAIFFCKSLAEDGQDGTDFDCDVLDAIEGLKKKHPDE